MNGCVALHDCVCLYTQLAMKNRFRFAPRRKWEVLAGKNLSGDAALRSLLREVSDMKHHVFTCINSISVYVFNRY